MDKHTIQTRWQPHWHPIRHDKPKCANGIFETKTKDGNTVAKAPAPRTNPNTKEATTSPKPHTHPSHEYDGQPRNPGAMTVHRHPSRHEKPKPSTGRRRPLPHVAKKTLRWRKWRSHGYAVRTAYKTHLCRFLTKSQTLNWNLILLTKRLSFWPLLINHVLKLIPHFV